MLIQGDVSPRTRVAETVKAPTRAPLESEVVGSNPTMCFIRDMVKFGITPHLGCGGPGFESLYSDSILFHSLFSQEAIHP